MNVLGFLPDFMTEHLRSFSWPRRIIPRARWLLHRSFLISIFCSRRGRTPRIPRGRITSCCRVITSGIGVHEGANASPRRGGRHLVNPLRLRWIDFPPNLSTSCFNHTHGITRLHINNIQILHVSLSFNYVPSVSLLYRPKSRKSILLWWL